MNNRFGLPPRGACLRRVSTWSLIGLCMLTGLPAFESFASGQDRRPMPNDKPEATKTEPPKTERQLAEERKARDAARKRGEITFDDLKFDIEKDGAFKKEMITKEIEELNKKPSSFEALFFRLPCFNRPASSSLFWFETIKNAALAPALRCTIA